MDHIKTQLDMLAELDDEQVSELQNSIVAEFDSVEQLDPTPETVDAMTALADLLDTVRGEVTRRAAQAEEREVLESDQFLHPRVRHRRARQFECGEVLEFG